MAQILRGPTRGEQLAGQLGRSLGTGLNSLIQNKIQKLKTSQGLQTLGIDKDQATKLANLPPEVQKLVYPQVIKNIQHQKNLEALQQQYGGGSGIQALQQMVPSPQEAQQPMQQLQQPQQESLPGYQPGKVAAQAYASGSDMGTAMRLEQGAEKMARQERAAEKKLAFTETKKFREDTYKTAENSKMDLKNLEHQRDLVNSGKLMGAREVAFMELVGNKLGFNEAQIDAFKNPETQLFEKLSVPFFRNLKQIFGARPTQWDAQQIQKGFPSLYQTEKGKRAIIAHMESDSKINIEKEKIMNRLLSENKDVPRLNLMRKTNEEIDKFRDKEYKKLKNTVSNILIKTAGPGGDPAKFKGKTVRGENNNVVFISDGKNWKVLYSDNME